MRHNFGSRFFTQGLSLALLLCLTPIVEAVDGVVLIDQNRALAGNVTPGDLPGFPVTISRAGSYRLSGNLDVADPDATAIEITTDDVTLDLNGFRIQGPADQCPPGIGLKPVWCSTVTHGVGVLARKAGTIEPLRANVAVLNGTVRAMCSDGLILGGGGRVERLVVSDNRGNGISVGRGFVRANTVHFNAGCGLIGYFHYSNNFFSANHPNICNAYFPMFNAGGNSCNYGPCP